MGVCPGNHTGCVPATLNKCEITRVSWHTSRALVCVSGSRPSEAYYQDVTEDGRQQPRRLNETWTLANW